MRYTPHLLCQISCLGILLGAGTAATAKPVYVPSTVNLRAAPGTTSEVVAKIPGGSLIDADNCTEDGVRSPGRTKAALPTKARST